MLPLATLQAHADQLTDAALEAAAHHRIRRVLREEGRRQDDVVQLRSLLEAAARTPLEDPAAWRSVRGHASRLTAQLAGEGRLPEHLVVDAGDVPVVVARTVAAAWRHVAGTPGGAGAVRPRPVR